MKRIMAIFLALSIALSLTSLAYAADIASTGKSVFVYGEWSYELIDSNSYKIAGTTLSDSDITLPNSFLSRDVTMLGNHVFVNSETLQSVVVPAPLNTICEYAFLDAKELRTVALPSTLTTIEIGAFSGTSALRDINLEDTGVTAVQAYCFMNSGLTTAILPDTCETIGIYAFAQCTGLTKITIPDSVSAIAENAFDGCDDLTIYCFTDSYAHHFAQENGISFVLLDSPPTWIWADDFSYVKAEFSDGAIVDAAISKTFDESSTTYTASVTYDGYSYTDERVRPVQEFFASHSISLQGDISINFYLNLTDAQAPNAKVRFSWDGEQREVSSFEKVGRYYLASCKVAVAEMNTPVTAKIYVDDMLKQTDVYSVKQYASYILTNQSFAESYRNTAGVVKYNQLITLIKAMLDYGSRAQVRFNTNADHLANDGTYYFDDEIVSDDITTTVNMNSELAQYGLHYEGTSVVYLSETSLRHHYTVINPTAFEAIRDGITFNGNKVVPVSRNGMIYFELQNIAAPNLDKQYALHIGDTDYYYAVLDYVKLQLSLDSVAANAKELGKATYRYNRAANEFFPKGD